MGFLCGHWKNENLFCSFGVDWLFEGEPKCFTVSFFFFVLFFSHKLTGQVVLEHTVGQRGDGSFIWSKRGLKRAKDRVKRKN